MPDKRLLPADRYLAHLMMNTMLHPLQKPQQKDAGKHPEMPAGAALFAADMVSESDR